MNSVFSHGAEFSGASHLTPECSSCSSFSYCASRLQTNGLLESPSFWYTAFSYNILNEVSYGFWIYSLYSQIRAILFKNVGILRSETVSVIPVDFCGLLRLSSYYVFQPRYTLLRRLSA